MIVACGERANGNLVGVDALHARAGHQRFVAAPADEVPRPIRLEQGAYLGFALVAAEIDECHPLLLPERPPRGTRAPQTKTRRKNRIRGWRLRDTFAYAWRGAARARAWSVGRVEECYDSMYTVSGWTTPCASIRAATSAGGGGSIDLIAPASATAAGMGTLLLSSCATQSG